MTGAVDHVVSMKYTTPEEGDGNTRKLQFLSRFDVADDTLLVRWDETTGQYSIVVAAAGLKDLLRETLADAGEPLTAAAIYELLPFQDNGTPYDIAAVRARLSEGAKSGLWAQPGKAGKSNLYRQNTPYTPL